MERGSDLYSQNLIAHFAGDAELQSGLDAHWQHEELQPNRVPGVYARTLA